jgi:hypothetical protein
MLAECVLNDTDMQLKNMRVQFTRYVDDFRIAVPAGTEAHSILCRLAEHLMVTEGLSLNVTKTKITSVRRSGVARKRVCKTCSRPLKWRRCRRS